MSVRVLAVSLVALVVSGTSAVAQCTYEWVTRPCGSVGWGSSPASACAAAAKQSGIDYVIFSSPGSPWPRVGCGIEYQCGDVPVLASATGDTCRPPDDLAIDDEGNYSGDTGNPGGGGEPGVGPDGTPLDGSGGSGGGAGGEDGTKPGEEQPDPVGALDKLSCHLDGLDTCAPVTADDLYDCIFCEVTWGEHIDAQATRIETSPLWSRTVGWFSLSDQAVSDPCFVINLPFFSETQMCPDPSIWSALRWVLYAMAGATAAALGLKGVFR